jgi:heme/copper-type cytochrome/quinol oxidase subunit 3
MRNHHCCAIQLNTIILLSSSLSISTPSANQEKNPQEMLSAFNCFTALSLSLSLLFFLENSENEISTAIV